MKHSILLFLVSIICAACAYGQAPSFLKQRCPSPNNSIFQTIRLASDGNQYAQPCPSGNFYINGAIAPTGSGTANRIPFWSTANVLGSTDIVWQTAPGDVLTGATGTLNLGGGTASYAYAIGNAQSYIYGLNGASSTYNMVATSTSDSSYRSGVYGTANGTPFVGLYAGGTGITGAFNALADSLQFRQYAFAGSDLRMEADWRTASGRWRVGDYTTSPTVYIDLNYVTNNLKFEADVLTAGKTTGYYQSISQTGQFLFTDSSAANVFDLNLSGFGNLNLNFSNGGGQVDFQVPTGSVTIGDGIGSGNSTYLVVNDASKTITLRADNGKGFIPFVDSVTPATSGDTCTKGMLASDSNYIYVCTAANTWKRATLAAF